MEVWLPPKEVIENRLDRLMRKKTGETTLGGLPLKSPLSRAEEAEKEWLDACLEMHICLQRLSSLSGTDRVAMSKRYKAVF